MFFLIVQYLQEDKSVAKRHQINKALYHSIGSESGDLAKHPSKKTLPFNYYDCKSYHSTLQLNSDQAGIAESVYFVYLSLY